MSKARLIAFLVCATCAISAAAVIIPKLPKVYRPNRAPTQGSGAQALIAPKAVPQPLIRSVRWRYAEDYTNVWFNLEGSDDMGRHWFNLVSNVTDETCWATNVGGKRVFRLKGRFQP